MYQLIACFTEQFVRISLQQRLPLYRNAVLIDLSFS